MENGEGWPDMARSDPYAGVTSPRRGKVMAAALGERLVATQHLSAYSSSFWMSSSSFPSFSAPAHLRTNLRSLSRNTVVGKLRTS